MKTKLILFAALLLASLFALSGCHKKDKAQGPEPELTVDVALPLTDSLTITKEYPAYIEAAKKVDAVARVDGYITAKLYKDGDYVRQGQALFRIEDTQYRDALSEANAALATAQSQSEYYARQYAAMQKAFESDAVSEMNVIQSRENLNQANAAIASARARVQDASTNLGYCTVRALTDGHISDAAYDVGTFVAGAAQPVTLATIYDDSTVKAQFAIEDASYIDLVKEQRHRDVNLGKVQVTFNDSLPSLYWGDLTYMAPDVDTSTGTLTMKVTLDNPRGEIKSGMYATVHLPVATSDHAILVQDAAISTDQRGKYLYTLNDSDRVVYTPVELGELYRDTLRVVISGIDPDRRYVTKALLKVRPGMAVHPRLVK